MQSYATPAASSAVMASYGNIIFLDRPVHDGDLFSRRHPAMTRLNRAKIFAPFAALVGFDERVRRKARANAVDINVEYYAVCNDSENDAYLIKGQYLTVTGRLIKADPHNQELTLLVDGEKKVIRFSDIYQITDPNDELFDSNNRRDKR